MNQPHRKETSKFSKEQVFTFFEKHYMSDQLIDLRETAEFHALKDEMEQALMEIWIKEIRDQHGLSTVESTR